MTTKDKTGTTLIVRINGGKHALFSQDIAAQLVPFMPSSAFGCLIFDGMIAPWSLAGAPSFLRRPRAAMPAANA